MFLDFVDENGKFFTNTNSINSKTWLELFEASHMGSEEENLMGEARRFSRERLKEIVGATSDNKNINKSEVVNALRLPLHWRGNIKRHISQHEKACKVNPTLVDLAKLNFNIIQAAQQEDLKKIAKWWMNLGLIGKVSFSRDRMVESFWYAGGVAFEPQYGSLRKWLSKVIKLVLIIDDVFGSLDELQCFSNAVQR